MVVNGQSMKQMAVQKVEDYRVEVELQVSEEFHAESYLVAVNTVASVDLAVVQTVNTLDETVLPIVWAVQHVKEQEAASVVHAQASSLVVVVEVT